MRKEAYSVGSYVHAIKRGCRGLPIIRQESDRVRFLDMLCHFNDEFSSREWHNDLQREKLVGKLIRPNSWPEQKKIVKLVSFCLLDNHFHLLLKEIVDGGISLFMKRIGDGMTRYYNEKYKTVGTIFQGAFRSRTITDDVYFRYVSAYIQIKNCFEMHPKGYDYASKNFEEVFLWASQYDYCSLIDQSNSREKALADTSDIKEMFTLEQYKKFSEDLTLGRNKSVPESVFFE